MKMIELSGLEKKGIRLGRCSEINDTVNLLGYANYIVPEKLGKVFRKEIDLQIPYKIDSQSQQGIMLIKVGKSHKALRGLYGHLLAIFSLVRQFQGGTLYCRYCKKSLPEQCQIVALLNFLET